MFFVQSIEKNTQKIKYFSLILDRKKVLFIAKQPHY